MDKETLTVIIKEAKRVAEMSGKELLEFSKEKNVSVETLGNAYAYGLGYVNGCLHLALNLLDD